MKYIFLTAFLSFSVAIVHGKNTGNSVSGTDLPSPDITALQGLHASLVFIENKGQVTDQNHNARNDIQFHVVAAPGLNIFIGSGAIHYQFCKANNAAKQTNHILHNDYLKGKTDGLIPPTVHTMYRVDVSLIGANAAAQVITEQKQGYYENYFTSAIDKHVATAHAYDKITYKDIYPNIDWVLYMSNGNMKHEFVIREGGKVSDIQIKYSGATSLKFNADGSLSVTTPQGTIREQAPTSYQSDGTLVKSAFKISGNILTYDAADYSGTLVIDPTLTWATYYGGEDNDYGNGVATDAGGNVYVTGQSSSIAGIATTGAYQTAYSGTGDAFLAKFDSAGAIQWATYYGGYGMGYGYGVATDNAGGVYITGNTVSPTGIATLGAYQPAFGGYQDAFLAKFNSAGVIQWGTYFGGNNNDQGYGVATDDAGDVYIVGLTNSTAGIATAGSYQPVFGDVYDAYLAKFSGSGSVLWATYFGGAGNDQGDGIATDASGNVYITGVTSSTSGIATTGAYQVTEADGGASLDAFLAKFSSTGVRQFATYYGGESGDEGTSVITDASGNIFISGYTTSTSGIATQGASQDTLGGSYDVFLAKFNNTGAIQWGTYYGGESSDMGLGIGKDNSGNVYITGYTGSLSGIATAGAFDTAGDGFDAFLAKFSAAGALQSGTYYGGAGDDGGSAVAGDNFGNVYITGYTNSTSGVATIGAYQATEADDGNAFDAFLTKFNDCPFPVAGVISGMDSVYVDSVITLTDAATGGTWSSNSNPIAVVNAGVVKGISIGIDTIKYTVHNACGVTVIAKKIIYVIGHNTGINNLSLPEISLYPNPFQNSITIKASGPIYNVIISNEGGQQVFTAYYNTNRTVINLAQLPSGVYIVNINGNKSYKILKE